METDFCPSCNKIVMVFCQDYTTLPQDEQNKVLRYKEVICAYCGQCIKRESVEEVAE